VIYVHSVHLADIIINDLRYIQRTFAEDLYFEDADDAFGSKLPMNDDVSEDGW